MLTDSPGTMPTARRDVGAWAVLALVAAAVGTAAWLVPASVRIVGWTGGAPHRLALVAPLSRLWIALVATGAIAGGAAVWARRSGRMSRLAESATPLLLLLLWATPYVPGLAGVPLLLLFSGPLRWVVAAVAVGCSAARAWGTTIRVPRFSRRSVFLISLALYAVLGLRFLSDPGLGGDQPHYLVITHSLLTDHDLDIGNNHERRDYRAFFGGTLRPDYLQRGRRGEIYSVHAPGLPVLLLPAYAVAGAAGAVAFAAFLGALTSIAVLDLAETFGGVQIAGMVWAAVCLTIPFAPHAWLIYPELPAALIVAWSILWIWRGALSNARLATHGVLLAALPWLHTKFVVLAAALALVQGIRLRPRASRIAIFLLPLVVGTAAWLGSFYWMYGTLDPQAPYGAFATTNVSNSNIPHGTLGLLFDKKFGLLVYSPIYALAFIGIVLLWRDRPTRWFAAALVATALVFLVSTTRFYMWWGGSSAPARFLMPVVPLAVPALAVAFQRARGVLAGAALALLLTASVASAAASVLSPRAAYLYSGAHGASAFVSAIQGGAPLDGWLPSFTEEQWHPSALMLLVWCAAIAVTVAATALAARARLVRTRSGVVTAAGFVFVAAAAALPGSRPIADREEVARNGQLALLRDYDAARLTAVDVDRVRRVPEPALFTALTLGFGTPSASADAGPAGPFLMLPAGEFEGRVWLRVAEAGRAAIRAELRGGVVLARSDAAAQNASVVRFTLPVSTPVRIAAEAANIRHLEIQPVRLPAGGARSSLQATAIDAADGPAGSYIAYLDHRSYSEGGVYWTRGTETSRVLIVPASGHELELVLHVGPNSGPVSLTAGGLQRTVEMAAGETRIVSWPIAAGHEPVDLTVRAERAFRPAATEPGSDDQRSLGCQVRPRIR